MTCSSCKYLKEGDYQEGSISGKKHYCSKIKEYVNGSNDKCSAYEKSYRSSYIDNQILEEGEKYYNDSTPIPVYILLVIIMLILVFITNIS